MKQEEILEGNKLIAEFMNKKLHDDWIKTDGKLPDLHYHTSWDWLMPTWVKFRDLRFDDETLDKLHNNYVARLSQDLAYGTISEFHSKISNGIKWYNTIKP